MERVTEVMRQIAEYSSAVLLLFADKTIQTVRAAFMFRDIALARVPHYGCFPPRIGASRTANEFLRVRKTAPDVVKRHVSQNFSVFHSATWRPFLFTSSKRFLNIIATATGPTPPGTGVNTFAFPAHAGSASPAIFFLSSLVPPSIRATPSLICSGFIKPGLPAPETMMSASLRALIVPS